MEDRGEMEITDNSCWAIIGTTEKGERWIITSTIGWSRREAIELYMAGLPDENWKNYRKKKKLDAVRIKIQADIKISLKERILNEMVK